jgi:hypothetical protein
LLAAKAVDAVVLGRRAHSAGQQGDLAAFGAGDVREVAELAHGF